MGTGATMTVSNQTNSAFTTTLSNLNCMYQNGDDGSNLQVFQGLNVPPYSTSSSQYIEADGSFPSCSFSQSSFQINYLNGSLGINLGTGPSFDTAVTSNTNPALLQAVLAPNAPVVSGPSYTFYFFGGPGIGAPLVNSVLNANLAAFAAAVQTQPFVFPVGPASVSISGVNFSSLACPYAAVVPAGPNQLQFTATLSATGTITGNLTAGPVSAAMDVSVTDLLVLVEGTADLSQAKPVVTVTLFACSLGSYSINGALLDALIVLFPPLLLIKTFATAPDVAGIINATGVNQTILNALNQALKNL